MLLLLRLLLIFNILLLLVFTVAILVFVVASDDDDHSDHLEQDMINTHSQTKFAIHDGLLQHAPEAVL